LSSSSSSSSSLQPEVEPQPRTVYVMSHWVVCRNVHPMGVVT
jgi:hypothetical protein